MRLFLFFGMVRFAILPLTQSGQRLGKSFALYGSRTFHALLMQALRFQRQLT